MKSPALAGFLRSEVEAALLGEVFCGSAPRTIGELARRLGIPIGSVSREVSRLERDGLVVTVPGPGRSKFVEPHPRLPFRAELARILSHTYGLPARLQAALSGRADVEQVIIFGSWAERFHGTPGRFPGDIDLIVVGTIDVFALNEALWDLEHDLAIEVHPIVIRPGDWDENMALIAGRPTVRVQLDDERQPV